MNRCFHLGWNVTHMKRHTAQFHVSHEWSLLPSHFHYLTIDWGYKSDHITPTYPGIFKTTRQRRLWQLNKHAITAFVWTTENQKISSIRQGMSRMQYSDIIAVPSYGWINTLIYVPSLRAAARPRTTAIGCLRQNSCSCGLNASFLFSK